VTTKNSVFWDGRRRYVATKRRFLQEPQGVTLQKTIFFTKALIDASKEVGLEINGRETKYMLISREQNAGEIII
jgi:hypothetical protein